MAFNPKCSVAKGFAMRESGLQNGDDFIKPNSGQNWLGQARTAASTQESCNILKHNSAHSTGSRQIGPQTVGPQGPIFHFFGEDSWALGPSCPAPSYLEPNNPGPHLPRPSTRLWQDPNYFIGSFADILSCAMFVYKFFFSSYLHV